MSEQNTQMTIADAASAGAQMAAATQPGDIYDGVYQGLKAAIFEAFQKYYNDDNFVPMVRTEQEGNIVRNMIKQGRRLFTNMRNEMMAGTSYYNCTTCRKTFEHMVDIWFLGRDGSYVSPLREVFKANGISLTTKAAGEDKLAVTFEPLFELSSALAMAELGGFTHFHAFTEEQVREYNELGSFEQPTAKALLEIIKKVNQGFDPAQLHATIKQLADTDRALGGLLHLSKIAPLFKGLDGDVGVTFLGHALRKDEWCSLKHFNGSMAGRVFANFISGADPKDIANLYLSETDPEKFKQKQAEASIGLLKQTKKTLEEKQMTGVLMRRIAVLGHDIPVIWSAAKDEAAAPVVETKIEGNDALSVFDKLIDKANNGINNAAAEAMAKLNKHKTSFDDLLKYREKITKITPISMPGFLEMLENVSRIALLNSRNTASYFSMMFTESQDTPGAFEFFKSEKTVPTIDGKRVVNSLMTVEPINRMNMLEVVGVEDVTFCAIEHIYKDRENVCVAFAGNKIAYEKFQAGRDEKFTIVGPEIKNELYGMASAIRDVTNSIGAMPLPEELNDKPVASSYLINRGNTFVVETKNGEVAVYEISSMT